MVSLVVPGATRLTYLGQAQSTLPCSTPAI